MKNILVLTPDRVGSTLLQRLLTVYMLRQGADKPIINLHELTKGLIAYQHEGYNQKVLRATNAGYTQSLINVAGLLNSVDHYKICRIAYYLIKARGDSLQDQQYFYEYLNKHFYIIKCQRNNLFEYALSQGIQMFTGSYNAFSALEKIELCENLYKSKMTLTEHQLRENLDLYKIYDEWSDINFRIDKEFTYETHINDIESFILSLDFMTANNNTWEDMFGISWTDWNTCHRMFPNLLLHNNNHNPNEEVMRLTTDKSNTTHEPIDEIKTIMAINQNSTSLSIPLKDFNFLEANVKKYVETNKHIESLVKNKNLMRGIPLKLQSLKEKQEIIINFDECIDWYNKWVSDNDYGTMCDKETLNDIAFIEENRLSTPLLKFDSPEKLITQQT